MQSFRSALLISVTFLITFALASSKNANAIIVQGGRDFSFQSGRNVTMGPNSDVRAVAVQSNGKILIGGSFTSYTDAIGVTTISHLARVDSDGNLDRTFNIGSGFNGWSVSTIAVQSDGKILVGGAFTTFNGVSRANLVRLNANGSLDTSFVQGTGIAGWGVYSLLVQNDGKIIVGGDFTGYNGNTANNVLRLNTNGSFDSSFNTGTGPNRYINSMALQSDGKVILGGRFTTIDNVSSNYIARLNTNGSLDSSFNVGTGTNGDIYGVAIQSDGKVLAGGWFGTYNDITRNYLVRINTDGSIDSTFSTNLGTGPDRNVNSVSVQTDGKIMLGGDFHQINGSGWGNFERIARLNSDGSLDTSYLGVNSDDSVYTVLAQSSGKVLIGGAFSRVNYAMRSSFARMNSDGTIDSTLNKFAGPDYSVEDVDIDSSGKVIIGGRFIAYDDVVVNQIARLNTNGTLDTGFDVGTGVANYMTVYAVKAQSDNKVLFGGDFTAYNGTNINRIARLNTNGSIDTGFDVGSGANATVTDIAVQGDGKVIVAGGFTDFNGTAVTGIVRLDTDGSIDPSFNVGVGADAAVTSVDIQSNGDILIGGNFTSYNGSSVNRVARLNIDGTLDSGFNVGAGADNTVNSIAVQADGKVIIGGIFTTFDGTASSSIARINSDGSLDTSFNVGTGANGNILSIVILSNGKVMIGGAFTSYNSATSRYVARLNSDGSLDNTFYVDNSANSDVSGIAIQSDSKVIVSRRFDWSNYSRDNYLSRLGDRVLYQIANLSTAEDAVNDIGSLKAENSLDYSVGSDLPAEPVILKYYNNPVADVTVDFSTASSDRDWVAVNSGSDIYNSLSFVENLNPVDAPGASSTHSLYVSKLPGQAGVFVCPNATALNQVNQSCTGGYQIDSGDVRLSEVNINGVDYWRIDGLTGTGALGLSIVVPSGRLTLTPNNDSISTTQEVTMAYTSDLGFVSGDKVQLYFEPTAGFVLANTCGTPTEDADGDTTVDGSATIVGSDVYEYTFSDTVAAGPLSFCAVVTSPATAGSYSVRLTDDNGNFDSAMYYVGDDNDVFVIANVAPSLSFNIRTLADDADTNSCSFGQSVSTPSVQTLVLGDFESLTFPEGDWTLGGDSSWFRDTAVFNTGVASAASGDIADSQTTWISYPLTVANDEVLSFDWKVDSEDTYDYLIFCLDNDACTVDDAGPTLQTASITGNIDWTNVTVPIPAGSHTLKWLYGKDSVETVGADMGWIDNVSITSTTMVTSTGNVSPSDTAPDYDNIDDGASECGYALAVGTNAANGFQVQITADDQLNGTSGNIADISNGVGFVAGVEAYGLANVTSSTSGRNVTTGGYTESILRNGNFNLAANTGTNIPLSATNFISYTNGIQYVAGVDSLDTTSVMHGLVIGSGTPAGYYDQVLTYTATANF